MAYATKSITIHGEVLGFDHAGRPATAKMDHVFRRKPGQTLESIVTRALAEEADDFANVIIDAEATMTIVRQAGGNRRARTVRLSRFPSVAWLLDLPQPQATGLSTRAK